MEHNQPQSCLDNLAHNLALGIIVDSQDLDLLETHRFGNSIGYATTKINGKTVYLHRLIHSKVTGKPLSEYTLEDHVRHIGPSGLDSRRSNLYLKIRS